MTKKTKSAPAHKAWRAPACPSTKRQETHFGTNLQHIHYNVSNRKVTSNISKQGKHTAIYRRPQHKTRLFISDCKRPCFASVPTANADNRDGLQLAQRRHPSPINTVQKMSKRRIRLHTWARTGVSQRISVSYVCTRFLPFLRPTTCFSPATAARMLKQNTTCQHKTHFTYQMTTTANIPARQKISTKTFFIRIYFILLHKINKRHSWNT